MIGSLLKRREGVGLDLGSQSIKAVQLRREGGEYTLVAWGKVPVPPGAFDRGLIKNRGAVAGAIERLFEERGFTGRKVITALPASLCFVKHLFLPPLGTRELRRAARLQVETYLPWVKEDAVIDVAAFGEPRKGQEIEALVVAARKTAVLEIERTLREAGLIPAAAEITPLACYRLLKSECDDAGILLVDMGASGLQFAYFARGRLKMVRSIALSRTDYEGPMVLEGLSQEIRKTLEYAQVQQLAVEPTRIVITGGRAEIDGIDDKLQSFLPYWQVSNIQELTSFSGMPDFAKLLGPSYAAALGMAWRGL